MFDEKTQWKDRCRNRRQQRYWLRNRHGVCERGRDGLHHRQTQRSTRSGSYGHGRVDIVFANAGIAEYGVFGQIDEAQYERIFGTNVKGVIFSVQAALPLMPDGGSIILNGSVVGSKGLPAGSVYAATKAAIRSFARTWTTDLKQRKIRVNVVSPGPIQTEGMEGLLGSGEIGQARREQISVGVPLGRMGRPEEIANAVVFLASDEASFVTASEFFVDGGFAQV
jgi:NAD(P)-dependent dehydrogenase (short-subunit alcohol dehydrogenase family)